MANDIAIGLSGPLPSQPETAGDHPSDGAASRSAAEGAAQRHAAPEVPGFAAALAAGFTIDQVKAIDQIAQGRAAEAAAATIRTIMRATERAFK